MRLIHLPGLARLVAGLALCSAALAQDARAEDVILEADRPDLAEGPAALAPRSVQLEMGVTRWLLTKSAIGRETLDSVGELLLRAGLAPGWEARLVVPSWNFESRIHPQYGSGGPRALETSGFGDAAVGVKRDLPSPHPRVEAGVIAEVSLPVGAAPFGGGDAGAGVKLAASLASALGDWCSNVGWARSGDADQLLATVAFERALAARMAAFGEVAWLGGDGDSRRAAGAGLLWQAGARTRLDVRVGGEFAGGASDPLFGLGVVQRW